MPAIHVCSLARLHDTVRDTGATRVITLINSGTRVERPASIAEDNHLFIGMSDILEPLEGHILPGEEHVRRLIGFVETWDRAAPMVIHCWAGVSRSTAAAFATACMLNPRVPETVFADSIRALSPTATPNLRLVSVADRLLGRGGRMVRAIEAIGRGADCFEGVPFRLEPFARG
jgi:predicted protein tyrosine phosphatase